MCRLCTDRTGVDCQCDPTRRTQTVSQGCSALFLFGLFFSPDQARDCLTSIHNLFNALHLCAMHCGTTVSIQSWLKTESAGFFFPTVSTLTWKIHKWLLLSSIMLFLGETRRWTVLHAQSEHLAQFGSDAGVIKLQTAWSVCVCLT